MTWKETADSIFIDVEVSFSIDTHTCECENSQFCDTPTKHLRVRDLQIIDKPKLKKLMTKDVN